MLVKLIILKKGSKDIIMDVPSTKSGKPWKLHKTIPVKDRTEALNLEKKIKKRGIKRFLEDNQFGV